MKQRIFVAVLLAALLIGAVASGQTADGRHQMVMIHGIGSNAEVWSDLLPTLERGFQVWLYELPGHGRTKPQPNLTIDSATDDLGRFLEAADPPVPPRLKSWRTPTRPWRMDCIASIFTRPASPNPFSGPSGPSLAGQGQISKKRDF